MSESNIPEIEQGNICKNADSVLFIVCMPEPQALSWNGQHAGEVWVGVRLLTGEYIFCDTTSITLVAKDFRTYVGEIAADVGVTQARRVLREEKKTH